MSIQSHILQDGTYIPQNLTISQIIAQNRSSETDADFTVQMRQRKAYSGIGLLSKTLIRSPMIKWIIPARIRRSERNLNDLIFVGENSIHVKEILPDGFLQNLGGRAGFPSQIRAAAVLGESLEVDVAIKVEADVGVEERGRKGSANLDLPPQILVLALANELRFICIDSAHQHPGSRSLHFKETSTPLIVFSSDLKNPGKFLVVDPSSRAIAVAASMETVVLYGLKDWQSLNEEYRTTGRWNPVLQERTLNVNGPVLAMDFINPDSDNQPSGVSRGVPTGAEGNQKPGRTAVLVIIVAVGRTNRVFCYEWNVEQGPKSLNPIVEHHILSTSNKSLSSSYKQNVADLGEPHCSFIIPMEHSSAFLVVHGTSVKLCQNILTGSINLKEVVVKSYDVEPRFPASCRRRPVYVAWKRCHRSPNWKKVREEALHLVREDGTINYITRNDVDIDCLLTNAGRFDCNVGTAFTNYFTTLDKPDYLIAAGCMSSAQVLSIGENNPLKLGSREEVTEPQNKERFPNWSAIMDLSIAQPPNTNQSRPGIFVTSGRQPYGAIHELRVGCEAKVYLEVDVSGADEMTGAYRMFALPKPDTDDTLLYLTYPGATTTWSFTVAEEENITAVEIGADCANATLLAAVTRDGNILQVTERKISVRSFSSLEDNSNPFNDIIPKESSIVAANFDKQASMLLLAIRTGDVENGVELHPFLIDGLVVVSAMPAARTGDATCLSQFTLVGKHLAATCFRDGTLRVYSLDSKTSLSFLTSHPLGAVSEVQAITIAESIIVLQDPESETDNCVILCGLRDGNLFKVDLRWRAGHIQWVSATMINMGTSPVTLYSTSPEDPKSSKAFAICGQDVCYLQYIAVGSSHAQSEYIQMSSVHHTESSNPSYTLPQISSLSPIPSPSSDLPAFISTDGQVLRFCTFDANPRTIPRSIPLKNETSDEKTLWEHGAGSPSGLLWSELLKCWIVASTKCELTLPPGTRPPKTLWNGGRKTRAIVQFIPQTYLHALNMGNNDDTLITLLPGERIRSMTEWNCRSGASTFYYVLVGTSRFQEDDTSKKKSTGRLLFLAPRLESDDSVRVELRMIKVLDQPVWAMAILNDENICICKGDGLEIWGFLPRDAPEDGRLRWTMITRNQLLSPGKHITCSHSIIYVTTSTDSIQAFKLQHTGSLTPPKHRLVLVFSDSIARPGLTHLTLHVPSVFNTAASMNEQKGAESASSLAQSSDVDERNQNGRPNLILLADLYGSITGIHQPEKRTNKNAADTVFELSLPQCVTKFGRLGLQSHGSSGVPWRQDLRRNNSGKAVQGESKTGVLIDDIIGTCTDGTVYQFSVIDDDTRIVLKFLENLVAWWEVGEESRKLRLQGPRINSRSADQGTEDEEERNSSGDELGEEDDEQRRIVIDPEHYAAGSKPLRKHRYAVNGDTLERFLEYDGREVLLEMLLGGRDPDDTSRAALDERREGRGAGKGRVRESIRGREGPNSRDERIRRFLECVDTVARNYGEVDKSVAVLDDAVDVSIRLLRRLLSPLL